MPVRAETGFLEIKPLNPHSRECVWRNNVVFQQVLKRSSSVLWQLNPLSVRFAASVSAAPLPRASCRNP